MKVRQANGADAASLSELMAEVEASSDYMLWKPGERETDAEKLRHHINNLGDEPNSSIFLAEENGSLIGYLMVMGGRAKRSRHTVYLVAGIKKESRGQGVGTLLFEALEAWARKHNIHRLELTTVIENSAGLALYKKMGFEIEGTKRDSLLIDGRYLDEFYMGRLL